MLNNKLSKVCPACLSISAITHRHIDLQKYKAIEKAQKSVVSTVYSSLHTSSFGSPSEGCHHIHSQVCCKVGWICFKVRFSSLLVSVLVRYRAVLFWNLSDITSTPSPSPSPSPSHNATQHPSSTSSLHSSICLFTFPTFASNHSPRQDCFPFNPDATFNCDSHLSQHHVQQLFFLLRKVIIDIIRCHLMWFFLYIIWWVSIPFYSSDHVQALYNRMLLNLIKSYL